MTSSVYGTRTESFFGAARKPSPPRQMGLPYMEEHRILRKRNKALESVVRRLGVELSQLHSAQLERDVEMERKYAAELAGNAAEVERVQRECEEEMQTCRSSVEARIAEEKRTALERQLIELTGTAEEKAAALQAKAKEERVELLRRQVGRRLMHSAISAGWSAWYELWTSRTTHCATCATVPTCCARPPCWGPLPSGPRKPQSCACKRLRQPISERVRKSLCRSVRGLRRSCSQ